MRFVGKHHIATLGVFLLASFASSGAATAATICDLRAGLPANTTCGIGSGLFDDDPTFTGFIDPFVRIQQNGWEEGYNTSGRPVQYNEIIDPNFTHDLLLSEVSTKTINGVVYREFFLDVNEPSATNQDRSFITLDQLEIYVSNTASLTSYVKTGNNNATGALTGATKIYDMDTASSDNYVQLDFNLSSGSSDMAFYLPNSLFGNNQYVYLYSQLGKVDANNNKYRSSAGFEEWGVRITAVPEPASLTLLGLGLAGLGARRWRQRKA